MLFAIKIRSVVPLSDRTTKGNFSISIRITNCFAVWKRESRK